MSNCRSVTFPQVIMTKIVDVLSKHVQDAGVVADDVKVAVQGILAGVENEVNVMHLQLHEEFSLKSSLKTLFIEK